ncbi:hypothetical protein GCM10027089_23880 [Nocardia thraciensis]
MVCEAGPNDVLSVRGAVVGAASDDSGAASVAEGAAVAAGTVLDGAFLRKPLASSVAESSPQAVSPSASAPSTTAVAESRFIDV